MRSQKADDYDDNRAGKHGDIFLRERQERTEKQRADNRGGRIDMLYEYIWHVACHHIAEKTAADPCDDADEDGEEYGRILGNLKRAHGTGNGENTKAD